MYIFEETHKITHRVIAVGIAFREVCGIAKSIGFGKIKNLIKYMFFFC